MDYKFVVISALFSCLFLTACDDASNECDEGAEKACVLESRLDSIYDENIDTTLNANSSSDTSIFNDLSFGEIPRGLVRALTLQFVNDTSSGEGISTILRQGLYSRKIYLSLTSEGQVHIYLPRGLELQTGATVNSFYAEDGELSLTYDQFGTIVSIVGDLKAYDRSGELIEILTASLNVNFSPEPHSYPLIFSEFLEGTIPSQNIEFSFIVDGVEAIYRNEVGGFNAPVFFPGDALSSLESLLLNSQRDISLFSAGLVDRIGQLLGNGQFSDMSFNSGQVITGDFRTDPLNKDDAPIECILGGKLTGKAGSYTLFIENPSFLPLDSESNCPLSETAEIRLLLTWTKRQDNETFRATDISPQSFFPASTENSVIGSDGSEGFEHAYYFYIVDGDLIFQGGSLLLNRYYQSSSTSENL